MTVQEAIATRRSVRSYQPRPVEENKLRAVLDAGRLAPSAQNAQNWKFIAVRDPELRARLAEACDNQRSVIEAPVIIVVVSTSSRDMACGQPTGTVNPTIAMAYMQLQAHELGLGTCWLGRFFADKVKSALDIPDNVTVVAVTPLGYAAEEPPAKPRFGFDEVISFDKF